MSFIKKNISVTKSVRDYALFCTFKHALRRHPVFASGRAGLVLLNVPEGYAQRRRTSNTHQFSFSTPKPPLSM
ncbi:hypothetical protein G6N76_03355 [Rhizobium daejeonense]|uniref:Uncharacterized protein n=1 Tax=Rhizobium daejeonense TaxID=240521 RepID=A0A6M1S2S5_9HYPH|nr:hypothetical protein [Rhizobium daejeonense]NGO62698.1 hypothetical protein [Rhizobium daejeonense]